MNEKLIAQVNAAKDTLNAELVQTAQWTIGSLDVGQGILTIADKISRAAIVTKINDVPGFPDYLEIWYKFIYRGAKGDMRLQLKKTDYISVLW